MQIGSGVSPPKTLTVEGEISASGAISTYSHITASGNISGSATSTGSFGSGYIAHKLGIGTTSASTALDVAGSSQAVGGEITLTNTNPIAETDDALGSIYFQSSDNAHSGGPVVGAKIRSIASANWNSSNTNVAPTNLEFYTQGITTGDGMASPRLIITSTGNVGIGNSAPSQSLTVNGNISASGDFILGDLASNYVSASTGNINVSGRIYEQGTSVVDHATAMAIVFGG